MAWTFSRLLNAPPRTIVWDVRVRAKGTAHVATALLARVDVLETFDRKLIDRSLIKVEGFARCRFASRPCRGSRLSCFPTSDEHMDAEIDGNPVRRREAITSSSVRC